MVSTDYNEAYNEKDIKQVKAFILIKRYVYD